jgi:PIN like domain
LPSDSPPEFFIDRSLGRHVVPDALSAAGATVHVMADVYGERIGQGLADTEWLRDAGANGWVVLMNDDKIRFRPAELEALTTSGVRAFCLTNANLRGAEMAQRFVDQLPKITRIATERPGPYIYGVYADGVRALWPK